MTGNTSARRLHPWSHLGGVLYCIGFYDGIEEEHTITLTCYGSHYISTMPCA